MRIVIDLQAVQTPGSRNRGVGRYSMSLLKSMLRHGGEHEFHIVLNGSFMGSVESIRNELMEWIPQDRFHIFPAIQWTWHINAENDQRRIAAEICREAFIANLKPDLVHVSSLFEGLADDSVMSIGRYIKSCPVAVTLYDLIPLIHRETYLRDSRIERWYEDRISHLRRADLLLAISNSSAKEAIDYMSFPSGQVTSIGTDADPQFEGSRPDPAIIRETHARLGVKKPFVMYTGGIDWRKNIEGLISAYAKLPERTRRKHQLLIVCAVEHEPRERLETLARSLGLAANEVLLTGFVSEADLIALYKSCKLFVFPSWHEGFGLPPLEAMRCGAPVIGGNRSSLPEVIGLPAAMFDPLDESEMCSKLEQGLTDEKFRSELVEHAVTQIKNFSWERTGREALNAIEEYMASNAVTPGNTRSASARKRLAFVSPIPPAASGIADYSAELIPELSRLYDLEIIVKDQDSADQISNADIRATLPIRTIDWMKANFDRYDRVLYQFGNSDHHNHMLYTLPDYPGVVVLHDFFLSGMIHFEQYHYKRGDVWLETIYRSHGYSAIAYQQRTDVTSAMMRYPANRDVVTQAVGVIVHSQHSKDLANEWLGTNSDAAGWHLIPHLRERVQSIDRSGARSRLGFGEDDFIVSSFGFVNPTKQSRRILEAWIASPLAQKPNAKLVFVGANCPGEYGDEMLARIDEAGLVSSVHIIGWTDQRLFREYLSASDVAVQLRTLSRGETSGTVLDAMNYGLATVVNAHGSMAYLPKDAVIMLQDEFTDKQLVNALVDLFNKPERRSKLAQAARKRIEEEYAPRACARAYFEAIESSYDCSRSVSTFMADSIRDLGPEHWESEYIGQVAEAIEVATDRAPPTSYLDVTSELKEDRSRFRSVTFSNFVRDIFADDLPRRLEPIYFDQVSSKWHHARTATLHAIDMPINSFKDDRVVFAPSSDLLVLRGAPAQSESGIDGQADRRTARVIAHWQLSSTDDLSTIATAEHPLAAAFNKLGLSMRPHALPETANHG
jgi:glycosyltransferase involved in cell wall biosynthesis